MFRIPGTPLLVCLVAEIQGQGPVPPAEQAITQIEALGGRVYRNADGRVDMVNLTGDRITDEHLRLLQPLTALRQLSLDGSRVTDQGIEQLLTLPNLEEVSLLRTQVTPEAVQSFKNRHPKIFHVALSPRTGPKMLAIISVVAVPLAIWGAWLMRMSMRKQAVLTQRQYAQGIGYGLLLIVVALVLLILGILKVLGIGIN